MGAEPGRQFNRVKQKATATYEASIVASSISMIGISSFTAYTRWHCLHFRLCGFSRYSSGCLSAGQTRISSRSLAIMTPALYDIRKAKKWHSTAGIAEHTEKSPECFSRCLSVSVVSPEFLGALGVLGGVRFSSRRSNAEARRPNGRQNPRWDQDCERHPQRSRGRGYVHGRRRSAPGTGRREIGRAH